MIYKSFSVLSILFLLATGHPKIINRNIKKEDVPATTTLKYKGFTVVFHGFKGYETESDMDLDRPTYQCSFAFCDTSEAILELTNDGNNATLTGALIVKKDTLHLSESLDQRINNSLIQIIPANKNDKFKVSFYYLSRLYEIIDNRIHSEEEVTRFYEEQKTFSEQTEFINLKDSSGYYFRTLPHTSDMEEVTVIDGKIVPEKTPNTPAEAHTEEMLFKKEITRIKKKYNLRDTLVVIPHEYDIIATLTGNKRLYDYSYDSFVFRIDRYHGKKIIESKFIVVGIAYGC